MARYKCPNCEKIYDEKEGDAHEGYPPGTAWEELPEDYSCSACFVTDKADFTKLDSESEND